MAHRGDISGELMTLWQLIVPDYTPEWSTIDGARRGFGARSSKRSPSGYSIRSLWDRVIDRLKQVAREDPRGSSGILCHVRLAAQRPLSGSCGELCAGPGRVALVCLWWSFVDTSRG